MTGFDVRFNVVTRQTKAGMDEAAERLAFANSPSNIVMDEALLLRPTILPRLFGHARQRLFRYSSSLFATYESALETSTLPSRKQQNPTHRNMQEFLSPREK